MEKGQIYSDFSQKIAIKKIKGFLNKFQKMHIFEEVKLEWGTVSVVVNYVLKKQTKRYFVKISIVGTDKNSKILIKSEKNLIVEYFLLELGKIL